MNLIKNAVAAIPDAGRISIRTSVEWGSVRVDITDNSIGIERERLATLFVPSFSRGGSKVKLGLGLVTARSIAHQHGGSLEIESDVGKGTHVWVTLPARAAEVTRPGAP